MDKYFWTEHAKFKLRQYGFSEQRIKRVLRNPYRKEEGIVKNTIAMMAPASTRRDCSSKRGGPVSTKRVDGKENWKQEIWVMIQKERKNKSKINPVKSAFGGFASQKFNGVKIISVWRYPGVSPKNNPIPEDILREIGEIC